MSGPSKEAEYHLTEKELADAIDDAQSTESTRLVRRLCFIRNLYKDDTVTEAADRVGVAQPTGSRWVEAWNAGGIDGLKPDFGDGRPSKLTEQEQETLKKILKRNQPLTTQQIQQIIEEGFGVSYSQRHILRLLKKI